MKLIDEISLFYKFKHKVCIPIVEDPDIIVLIGVVDIVVVVTVEKL